MKKGVIFIIVLFWHCWNSTYSQTSSGSFQFENNFRDYEIFLPKTYASQSKLPLVLNLHALYGDGEDEMNYTLMNEVADTSGFIIVYPSAIDGTWNSGISDDPEWPYSNSNDVGFISALIDTLNANYKIDLKRVYVCGHSNGGSMSYKLACESGSRIAAAASVSGALANSTAAACTSLTEIPILIMHGTSDPIIPFNGNNYILSEEQPVQNWLSIDKCMVQPDTIFLPDTVSTDSSSVQKISYSDCSGNSEIIFYKIINGGHGWPGASENFPSFGKLNKDINANTEILNFFRNFSLIATDVYVPMQNITPGEIQLDQNFPNPFTTNTSIRFSLPSFEYVILKVFDLQGREVATLVKEDRPGGVNSAVFAGSRLASGIYYYQLKGVNLLKQKNFFC